MEILIPSCASRQDSEKKLAVFVDSDALARFECELQDREEVGRKSHSHETANLPFPESATKPLKIASSLLSSSAPKNSNLEEPGPEPLAGFPEDPDALTPAKDRIEHLRALINDIRNRVPRSVAGTLPIDIQDGMDQTALEGAVEGIFDESEDLPPETKYGRLLGSQTDDGPGPAGSEQRVQPASVAPLTQASRATEPGEVKLTRSLPASESRRILLRVAISLALVLLNAFCIIFLHEIAEPTRLHFTAGSGKPPDVPQPAGVVSDIWADDSIANFVPTASRPVETDFRDRLSPNHAQIKVLEMSWVSATADGKDMWGKLLNKGEIKVIGFSQMLLLRIGNAGGIEITLGGKPIGPIGSRGMVRLVELTPIGSRILPSVNPPAASYVSPRFELSAGIR